MKPNTKDVEYFMNPIFKFTRVHRVGNCNPSNHTTSWNSCECSKHKYQYFQFHVQIVVLLFYPCGRSKIPEKYIILIKHVSKSSYQFCYLYVYFTLQWTESDHIKYVNKYLQQSFYGNQLPFWKSSMIRCKRCFFIDVLKIGEVFPMYIHKGKVCDVSNERAGVKGVSVSLNGNVPFLKRSKPTSS